MESPAPLFPREYGALAGVITRFILFFSPRCAGVLTTFRRKYQGAETKSGALAVLRRGFAFDAILNRHAKITGRTHGLTSLTMAAESKKVFYVRVKILSFHACKQAIK